MKAARRAARPRLVEWAVAARTKAGETTSGDRFVVAPFPEGVLVAAVDGLGHGDQAARASEEAVRVLERQPQAPLADLVRLCHDALAETRGAVLSLAVVSGAPHTLTWIGVGNVEGLLLRADPAMAPAREVLLLRGGVVGYQLPHLAEAVLPVTPGDLLVLATDGVRAEFVADARPGERPRLLADRLLRAYARGTDDALVLVAEILGRAS